VYGGSSVKDNRAPLIADICLSLQWFMLIFSVFVIIGAKNMDNLMSFCLRGLVLAVAYVLMAVTVHCVRPALLRLLIPLAVLTGSVFLGTTIGERVCYGIIGAMAAVFGIVLFYRVNRESTIYTDMFYFAAIPMLVAIIAWKFEMNEALRWINIISAIYLPVGVVSWMTARSASALVIFSQRADQPLKRINGAVVRRAFTVAFIVLFVSLALPQVNDDSLLMGALKMIAVLILSLLMSLARITPSCGESGGEKVEAGEMYIPESDTVTDNSVFYIIAYAVLAAVVVLIAVMIIRFVCRAIKGYLQGSGMSGKDIRNNSDVVEKLERQEDGEKSGRSGRSNAAKVRRIYKKRVSSILGKEKVLRDSLTSSEIMALCRRKGEDISELTALYRKARYSQNCTAEDVNSAKRL